LGQKEGFDPEKCQKERFAPLPAVLLARRCCGGVEGLSAIPLAGLAPIALNIQYLRCDALFTSIFWVPRLIFNISTKLM
jgi:hypothetical protein